jgi:hypothetical protein
VRVLILGISHAAMAYTWVSPLSKDTCWLPFPCLRHIFRCRLIVIVDFDKIPCNFNVVWLKKAMLNYALNFSWDYLLFLCTYISGSR